MKTNGVFEFLRHRRSELVARWGEAELVRHLDGRYELRGGTAEDRQAAREWCSLFLHDAVLPAPHACTARLHSAR